MCCGFYYYCGAQLQYWGWWWWAWDRQRKREGKVEREGGAVVVRR
jgi:hypothetical protein